MFHPLRARLDRRPHVPTQKFAFDRRQDVWIPAGLWLAQHRTANTQFTFRPMHGQFLGCWFSCLNLASQLLGRAQNGSNQTCPNSFLYKDYSCLLVLSTLLFFVMIFKEMNHWNISLLGVYVAHSLMIINCHSPVLITSLAHLICFACFWHVHQLSWDNSWFAI